MSAGPRKSDNGDGRVPDDELLRLGREIQVELEIRQESLAADGKSMAINDRIVMGIFSARHGELAFLRKRMTERELWDRVNVQEWKSLKNTAKAVVRSGSISLPMTADVSMTGGEESQHLLDVIAEGIANRNSATALQMRNQLVIKYRKMGDAYERIAQEFESWHAGMQRDEFGRWITEDV